MNTTHQEKSAARLQTMSQHAPPNPLRCNRQSARLDHHGNRDNCSIESDQRRHFSSVLRVAVVTHHGPRKSEKNNNTGTTKGPQDTCKNKRNASTERDSLRTWKKGQPPRSPSTTRRNQETGDGTTPTGTTGKHETITELRWPAAVDPGPGRAGGAARPSSSKWLPRFACEGTADALSDFEADVHRCSTREAS